MDKKKRKWIIGGRKKKALGQSIYDRPDRGVVQHCNGCKKLAHFGGCSEYMLFLSLELECNNQMESSL